MGIPAGHERLFHLGEGNSFQNRQAIEQKRKYTTEDLARPSRNGCRGPLDIAIDIATRYRKSPIRSIAIANRDIDSERTTTPVAARLH